MNQLTFLLYILAKSVNSIRPQLVEALRQWPDLHPNLNLSRLHPVDFCKHLNLTITQTQKFISLYHKDTLSLFAQRLKKYQIRTINIFEADYPEQLSNIPDPPLVIYYRGNSKLLLTKSVAIVGSRKASQYGKSSVEKILSELTGTGITIISGLAFGIDYQAHAAALKNNLGTIAVLGSGVEDEAIYPKENFPLAVQILSQHGLILSEYPPHSFSMKHQFIARNRIIAALSQITIVMEAGQNSGALLTADFAVDYNRSVYALPGPINSLLSAGPHKLIQNGAAMLTSGQDIAEELGVTPRSASLVALSPQEKLVYQYIQTSPKQIEQMLDFTQLDIASVSQIITNLELNNLIYMSAHQTYSAK